MPHTGAEHVHALELKQRAVTCEEESLTLTRPCTVPQVECHNVKALHRKALALKELGRLTESLDIYRSGVRHLKYSAAFTMSWYGLRACMAERGWMWGRTEIGGGGRVCAEDGGSSRDWC
jgi:hypothetical protein